MSVWNDHKPAAGGGDYLKLKGGDRKKVRFVSEPAVITYDGVKLRYQVVLYNKTDKLAQVYEFGPQVFGQIAELAEDWGDPTQYDMTISRQGSTQYDTSYTVTPLPKSEVLTKDELEATTAVKFPTSKARLLSDYMEDGIMPETIETTKSQNNYVTSDEELNSLVENGSLIDDMPDSF